MSNIRQPIYLRGEKYLLKGKINVDQVSLGVPELPESILLNIVGEDGSLIDNTEAKLTLEANDPLNSALYEYSVWASSGEKLTFVPVDSRSAYVEFYLGGTESTALMVPFEEFNLIVKYMRHILVVSQIETKLPFFTCILNTILMFSRTNAIMGDYFLFIRFIGVMWGALMLLFILIWKLFLLLNRF